MFILDPFHVFVVVIALHTLWHLLLPPVHYLIVDLIVIVLAEPLRRLKYEVHELLLMCSFDHLRHHVPVLALEDQVQGGVGVHGVDALQDFVVQHVNLSDEHIVHVVGSQVSSEVPQDFEDIIRLRGIRVEEQQEFLLEVQVVLEEGLQRLGVKDAHSSLVKGGRHL